MAHGGPRNAQLGTDLAQDPALGIQVGCTLNVHCAFEIADIDWLELTKDNVQEIARTRTRAWAGPDELADMPWPSSPPAISPHAYSPDWPNPVSKPPAPARDYRRLGLIWVQLFEGHGLIMGLGTLINLDKRSANQA
jgi:hypothetical protein